MQSRFDQPLLSVMKWGDLLFDSYKLGRLIYLSDHNWSPSYL